MKLEFNLELYFNSTGEESGGSDGVVVRTET